MWLSLANASPPFISYMVRNSLPQKIQKGQFENVWVSYMATAAGRDLGQSPYRSSPSNPQSSIIGNLQLVA
ncbi:hypothetical protein NC652_005279 [Populus alba x Populus x berolinensis]|nr:hypothetical protein NC652_005279 [Populus alba x Populus x berolinensis]